MAKKQRKTKSSVPNTVWDKTLEGPRKGLPESAKLAKRSARMRFAIWACLVLLPFLVLGNAFMVATMLTDDPDVAETSLSDEFVETKSTAILTVNNWLAQSPSPLPGGKFVGWDSATTDQFDPPIDKATGEPIAGEQGPYRVETHKVTVSASGSLFHVAVQVAYDEYNGAVSISDPSLLPYVPANAAWTPDEFPNHETVTIPEAVSTAVSNWATAYTSGDPQLLIQSVRDTDETHSYLPLTGARLREVTAVKAWIADPINPDDEPDPNEVFVRVTAHIDWESSPVEESRDAPMTSFDVLIQDALTAAPVVVAWGGPGDGADLVRYDNAITTRDIRSGDSLIDPSANPSPEVDPDVAPEAAAAPEDETTKPKKKKKKSKKKAKNS